MVLEVRLGDGVGVSGNGTVEEQADVEKAQLLISSEIKQDLIILSGKHGNGVGTSVRVSCRYLFIAHLTAGCFVCLNDDRIQHSPKWRVETEVEP